MKASELDKIFDDGQEDILPYMDLSKTQVINTTPKRVNVNFFALGKLSDQDLLA